MNASRRIWQTPTGAMLWEMWARNKVSYFWHGVALAAGLCFVQWKRHGVSEIPAALMGFVSLAGFVAGYFQMLSCFAFVEVDPAKVNSGYPGRLLLKPLRTFHLAMAPMLAGGVVTILLLDIWLAFVLKPLGFFPVYDLSWISALMLSFFWWMQALVWGLPLVRFKSFVIVAVAFVHLIVGVMPQLPFDISPAWQWGIVTALLFSAPASACAGLRLMRQGKWDGWNLNLWNRWIRTRSQFPRAKFRSAFAAQFWMEWRRQGWLLPGFTAAMALLVIPAAVFIGFKWSGVEPPPPQVLLALMLCGPLLLSGMMGPALAKFDLLGSSRELPVYISVRPMTNGGFVLAKLAMALASSTFTLLVCVAGIALCFAITGQWTLFSSAGLVTPLGTVSYLSGCLPVLLLLVILVWKNLMAGIGTGLTGRPWIANVGIAWRGAAYAGLMALVMAAVFYPDFKETLLHQLTAVLILCLAVKLALTIAAFVGGFRRNAITTRAIGWIVCAWLVCGLFVAGFANHVCNEIHQPNARIWLMLGGLLILPLADLAIAPLALAWNRHR